MKENLVAAISGLLFSLGLGVAGMTQPEKVLAFLDFTGSWDPSLALVMVGAIGVNALAWQWARRQDQPVIAQRFYLPTNTNIDWRLVGGAALFGAGWGLAGYCPGPGLVSIVCGAVPTLIFVGTMLLGMGVFAVVERTLQRV